MPSAQAINKKSLLWFVPAAVALCVIIFFAFRCGWSDLYAFQVRNSSDQWFKEDRLPSEDELNTAFEKIDGALDWYPAYPEYLESKAYLLWLAILREQRSGNEGAQASVSKLAQQAAALHREAIENRPNWPYSWSGLVLMKAYQAQYDAEFDQAVANAVRFGPWENTVNVQLALSTQIAWGNLKPATQKHLLDNMARAVRRNFKVVQRQLAASNKRYLICGHLPQTIENYKKLCQ